MTGKKTIQIKSIYGVSWNIGCCQVETSINVNEVLIKPSATSKTLQTIKTYPITSLCIKDFQWQLFTDIISSSPNNKHQ